MEEWTTKTRSYNHVEYSGDVCGEKIDSADELDDGWVPPSSGNVEIKIDSRVYSNNVDFNCYYEYKACLCDQCKEKVIKEMQDTLNKTFEQLGFKPYEY